jgi:hypothetical protein
VPHGHGSAANQPVGAEPPAGPSLPHLSSDTSVVAVVHDDSSEVGISAVAGVDADDPTKTLTGTEELPTEAPTRRPLVIRLDENDNIIFIGEPGSEEDPMREWELAKNKDNNGYQVSASLVGTTASQKADDHDGVTPKEHTPTPEPSVVLPIIEEPPTKYTQEEDDGDPELAATVELPEDPVNLEPAMAAFFAIATVAVGFIALFV